MLFPFHSSRCYGNLNYAHSLSPQFRFNIVFQDFNNPKSYSCVFSRDWESPSRMRGLRIQLSTCKLLGYSMQFLCICGQSSRVRLLSAGIVHKETGGEKSFCFHIIEMFVSVACGNKHPKIGFTCCTTHYLKFADLKQISGSF